MPFVEKNPSMWPDLVALWNSAWENAWHLFRYWIPVAMPYIKNCDYDMWIAFLTWIAKNKDDIEIISKLTELSNINNLWDILSYYVNYKQKSLINLIQKLYISKSLKLATNYTSITNLLNLDFLNWLDKEQTRLQKIKIEKLFDKLLNITNFQNKENKKKELSSFLRSVSIFDYWKKEQLKKKFADVVIAYFNIIFDKKLKTKLKSELGKDIKIEDEIIKQRINKPEFIEAFIMFVATTINKQQFKDILINYLKWNDWFVLELPENKLWLTTQRKKRRKIDYYLQKNEELYNIESNDKDKKITKEKDILHHFTVAKDKLKKLWLETNFRDFWELLNYFDSQVKPKKEELKSESKLSWESFENLFNDLLLQVQSIKRINTSWKARNITKIKIYKETNPLRVLMMWKWFDWSCLSFYHTFWNYWSTATNALDINKWVYYIEDQDSNIIWRVLTAIDEEWKLLRFYIYKKWNIWVDLDKYFNEYIKNIAEKSWLWLNWNIEKVSLINWEKWYKDPVKKIT